ncbi:hypothetical protein PLANPX_2181 [Lacipirellula parvula]|uniref:Glycoside hydrolase family 42 N-terminal domain-containing protein n=1 Tax=Lacipirellula parvula TaxID=2650471 RepID=A0A5K7XHZ8_9BACT|nr:hypothetical protein PLANPX_2181 [Lacipirellula parvula]
MAHYFFNICRNCFLAVVGFVLVSAVTAVAAEPAVTVNDGPLLPIFAWEGVPAAEATPERFKELADAGFTISFSGAPDNATVTKMLDAAETAGVKLYISSAELHSDPEGTARLFKNHPALGGYHLVDEPSAKSFGDLGAWTRRIQSVDAEHPVYINLLPTYGNPEGWGTPDYATYVERFLAEVPTQQLSYDHYPIVQGAADSPVTLRSDFYENLEICSAAAREANRPLWTFALLVAHTPYPIPTLAHLRLQAYSDLAYGTDTLQYFTYWTPVSTIWNFHEAPINPEGKRTPTYDLVKAFNAELQAVRGVFVGSQVESVGHTGAAIPAGTKPFAAAAPIKSLQTEGTGVVASRLAKGDQRFLVLVNRDLHQPTTATVEFDGSTRVSAVAKDGTLQPLEGATHSVAIEPGDVAIYAWQAE